MGLERQLSKPYTLGREKKEDDPILNTRVQDFEKSKENYLAAIATPYGRMFYDVLEDQLNRHLPPQSSVLDIGCGFGLLDRRLAAGGHRVRGLDLTPGMLEVAREEAARAGYEIPYGVLDLEAADITAVAEAYDVTVLHNVLEYTNDPAGVIRKIAAWTKPGGLFSLVLHNPAGKVLNAAIFQQDPAGAVEALANKPHYVDATDTCVLNYPLEQAKTWLDAAGFELVAHYGVRTVYDWIPNDPKEDPAWHEQALRMEKTLCDKEPYRSIAKFTHLICRRKKVHTDMRERLLELFDTLHDDDQEFMVRLLEAKIRSNQSPLAYIEEMMSYQFRGQEGDVYVHTMEVRPEISNRYGMLHGGILSTFIDTAMGATCFVANGPTHKMVTLDLQVRFLKEARQGDTLTCKTKLLRNGRTVAVLESHVYDEKGNLIGNATGSFFKIPK